MTSFGPGRHADPDQPTAYIPPVVVTHLAPADSGGLMPCCGRTPYERRADRITLDKALVTCNAPARPPRRDALQRAFFTGLALAVTVAMIGLVLGAIFAAAKVQGP